LYHPQWAGEPRAAAQEIVSSYVAFPDTTLLVGSQSREHHLISAVALGRLEEDSRLRFGLVIGWEFTAVVLSNYIGPGAARY